MAFDTFFVFDKPRLIESSNSVARAFRPIGEELTDGRLKASSGRHRAVMPNQRRRVLQVDSRGRRRPRRELTRHYWIVVKWLSQTAAGSLRNMMPFWRRPLLQLQTRTLRSRDSKVTPNRPTTAYR